MKKIYELNEYENTPGSDNTFSNRKPITFSNPKDCLKFIKNYDFYGVCFVYDYDEYTAYYEDYSADLPEPIDEFTVDFSTSINDFIEEL